MSAPFPEDGDLLLLCTGGLTDMVAEKQIAQILTSEADPQKSCTLVDSALKNGGSDNITVVLGNTRLELKI